MLVLTRKVGDEFAIGDRIRVVVVAIEGKSVRLGVVAPREIPVVRDNAKRRDHRPPRSV